MIRAMYSSASGMQAEQTNIDVISNNLANVNTNGYKRATLQFQDLMYQTDKSPGARLADGSTTATGLQVGFGVQPVATSRDFSQGDMVSSGGTYDLAIQGKGFFQVQMPDGTFAYTRDGSFKINQNGNLVNNSGYKLVGVDQIDTQATEVSISRDGAVTANVNGQLQALSPITLAAFANPEGLKAVGDNLYVETDASGPVQSSQPPGQNGVGTIAQGYTESSNVRVVEEMVKMIQAQRAYEVNSKAIQASDEMLSTANNLRR